MPRDNPYESPTHGDLQSESAAKIRAELYPPQAEVVASSRSGIPELEQEKRDAFDAGFRDGYLDQIPVYFRKGDLGVAYAHGLKAGEAARIPPEPPPAQGKEEAKQGEVEILREFVKAWDAQIVMAGIWMVDCACQSRLIPKMQEAREVLRRKESPCSNESGAGCLVTNAGPASASNASRSTAESSNTGPLNATNAVPVVTPSSPPNPPAWATPQKPCAVCGKVRGFHRHPMCRGDGDTEQEWDEQTTIPTPPAAKCDGSGRVPDPGYNDRLCLGCPACKPEPKKPPECDGSGNIPGYGSPWPCEGCRWCKPEPKDGADWTNAKVTPIYKPARPDLDKVRELCRMILSPFPTPGESILAREVLAELEAP